MPRRYSSRHIIRILEQNGFIYVSQRGSHVKYRKGSNTVIVVAGKREVPMGTFASIVRQSGLPKKNFEK